MNSVSFSALAHAKINLFLHVTGRRANGYHELDSLAVFAAAADMLTLEPKNGAQGEVTLDIAGRFGGGLRAESDNLVLRAADALRRASPKDQALGAFHVVLKKELPVASGIGGGSADAACALRLFTQAWSLPDIDLGSLAASLGADVPVCVAQKAARMQGIGEILRPAPRLPPVWMVLANPGVAVPTPQVFAAWKASGVPFRPQADLPEGWEDVEAMARDLRRTSNDLQPPAIALFPVIGRVVAALETQPGCKLARMSGSGATCFGLFAEEDAALCATRVLEREGWWTSAGLVRET